MAKIILDTITGGYDLSVINNNFDKIETELNNKVLYRNPPEGEANTMEQNLDMNNKSIYNTSSVATNSLTINGQSVVANQTFVTELPDPIAQGGKYLYSDGVAAQWKFIPSTEVTFTPTAGVSANTVQAAIEEVYNDFNSTGGAALVGFSSTILNGATAKAGIEAVFNNRPYITPTDKEFGAAGDGVADDTSALQAAINSAISSKKVLDLGGSNYTYKITSALTGGSNLHIRANGATINMSAIASGEKTAIICAGSAGSGVAITAGSTPNSYTINLANTSAFAVGDFVQIDSADVYPYGGGSYNVARGEIKRIRSIVANTSITFTTPIIDTYTTTPLVRPITWIDNVQIEGVKFVGLDTPATTQRGIALRYVRNFNISENVFTAQDTYQVELASSILGFVKNNRFTGVFYDGVTGTVFYGIAVLDCTQWVEIAGNIGDKVRHLVITSSRTSGQGFFGQPYFINIHHNISFDSMAGGGGRSYAFESHGFGRYTVWNANQAHGCYAGFNADGGEDILFCNNQITGYAFQGIIVGEPGTKAKNIAIINNTVDNYTGEVTAGLPCAVRLEVSDEMSNILIENNKLTNCTSIASPGTGEAFTIGASTLMRGIVFRGNYSTTRLGVENTAVYGIAFAAGTAAILENNHILGWRNGISVPTGSSVKVFGGSVRNYSVGGTGFGVYSNGDRTIFKDIHIENINTAIRLDTASTNCLATANTMTGVTVTTPSNAGTGNTTTGNFIV